MIKTTEVLGKLSEAEVERITDEFVDAGYGTEYDLKDHENAIAVYYYSDVNSDITVCILEKEEFNKMRDQF